MVCLLFGSLTLRELRGYVRTGEHWLESPFAVTVETELNGDGDSRAEMMPPLSDALTTVQWQNWQQCLWVALQCRQGCKDR